jgi:hypothetical protein
MHNLTHNSGKLTTASKIRWQNQSVRLECSCGQATVEIVFASSYSCGPVARWRKLRDTVRPDQRTASFDEGLEQQSVAYRPVVLFTSCRKPRESSQGPRYRIAGLHDRRTHQKAKPGYRITGSCGCST